VINLVSLPLAFYTLKIINEFLFYKNSLFKPESLVGLEEPEEDNLMPFHGCI
jgi:hypothetical protein